MPADCAMTDTRRSAAKIESIAVIVVNYNTAARARQAVESVVSITLGGRQVTVHVVDNASPDGDAAELAQQIAARGLQDRVILYAEPENHGFGRGNNVVLHELRRQPQPPEAVFFLNPDACLDNEAINILAGFLEAHPDTDIAGARIEKPDGQPVTAAFRFPGLISTFSHALSFGPVSRPLARWDVALPPGTATGPVDWVSGAAFLARFDALERAGFFDPAFFLYFEEVDLMRAVNLGGGDIRHVAEARAIHAEGAATGVGSGQAERKRRPAYWYHSWQYYLRKNHGRFYALLAMILWGAGAALNTLLSKLRGKPPAAPLHLHRDLWAVAGRPLVGLRARPYD